MLAQHERILLSPLPRALLGALAQARGRVRFTEARRCLQVQGLVKGPQEVQRALDQLMDAGLVQACTIPKREGSADERPLVLVEASLLGRILWRYDSLMADALAQAAAEFGFTVDQLHPQGRPSAPRIRQRNRLK